MLNVVRGSTTKPAAGRKLIESLSAHESVQGYLYVGYPIIGTPDGPFVADALQISRQTGVVAFDLVEGPDVGDFKARQDDGFNKLHAMLMSYRSLTRGRSLAVPVEAITFAPAVSNPEMYSQQDSIVANAQSLATVLPRIASSEFSMDDYHRTLSAIQTISSIRRSHTLRIIEKVNSRGSRLKALEDSIATLDPSQSRAVIETVDGVQRIRGLAGSGKTIVLALKAAYLHAQNPTWRIGVTFHTRSLKAQFRRLINNFSVERTGAEPNWDRVRVLNSWGAPGGHQPRWNLSRVLCLSWYRVFRPPVCKGKVRSRQRVQKCLRTRN